MEGVVEGCVNGSVEGDVDVGVWVCGGKELEGNLHLTCEGEV
jgi:hypothetical protein